MLQTQVSPAGFINNTNAPNNPANIETQKPVMKQSNLNLSNIQPPKPNIDKNEAHSQSVMLEKKANPPSVVPSIPAVPNRNIPIINQPVAPPNNKAVI